MKQQQGAKVDPVTPRTEASELRPTFSVSVLEMKYNYSMKNEKQLVVEILDGKMRGNCFNKLEKSQSLSKKSLFEGKQH